MRVLCALVVATSGAPGPAAGAALPLRTAVGTNLDPVIHYSPQIPFADVMKSAAPWGSGDKRPLDLDERGGVRSLEPGQIARTLMLREFGTRYPAGRYVVRYRGEGTLVFRFAAKVVSARAGEILLDVTPEPGGIYMEISRTDPGNPVRDIRVTMPGGTCEGDPFTHASAAADCGNRRYLPFAASNEAILFNPVFLDRLRGYSVLRFMDWMRTNNSANSRWSKRARLEDAMWTTDAGAPVEVMVALANATGSHPWFTLPHLADDDYVESFARLVGASLRKDLGAYVEHSNEVWNPQFAQHRHAVQQGKSRFPPIDQIQYHAEKTRTVGAAFAKTLGPSRVVTALGAQAGNPWTTTRAMEHLKKKHGDRAHGIDAIAIAPYFGIYATPKDAPRYAGMSQDELFAHVRATVLPEALGFMRNYGRIAGEQKLDLIAYEGGQHLSGVQSGENHEPLNVVFDAFNRDPRIRQLYLDYLDEWKRAGGRLFVHYTDVGRFTKWGRWGALEYIAQPRETAPKFDALHTFIERNPPWWR